MTAKTTAKKAGKSVKTVTPKPKKQPETAVVKSKSKARTPETAASWIPQICTKGDLSVILDMAMRNVSDQAARGVLVAAPKRGMFLTLPSIQGYISRLRETAAGRNTETVSPLKEEQLQETKVNRQIAELKLANLRGEMVSANEIEENWSTFAGSVKSKILSVPTKCRAKIPHLTAHDQETIRDIVHDILNDIADEIEASVIGGEGKDVKP